MTSHWSLLHVERAYLLALLETPDPRIPRAGEAPQVAVVTAQAAGGPAAPEVCRTPSHSR